MKTWKHYLAITAVATALMGGAAFAQQAPQNAPWLYGQDQQQVQPVQRGQDDHNRQQSGINQLSGKQQSKDTKNQKNLKKETAPKKQTVTKDKTKDIQKIKNTKETASPYQQNQAQTYRNYAPGYNR
ncbi:hypothetical protein [uncultured Megasphaera sp.]|uniref:hypothetical protein n=1 Tax=uncultured Megasphaera sp. TaxID=165188 RepID=UPI00260665E6|nr:hypothetical protein [uncultured Megasphaera sp.]